MIRYHARWVVPVTSPPIPNGTVVEDRGTIVYVGAPAGAPPGSDADLGDVLLLPGLVNAHTHLELTGLRGLIEDLEFDRWIRRLMQLKDASLDPDALFDGARRGIAEGVNAGITTFADTCASGVAARAMREAGVRGIMYQEVFGPAASQRDASMAELRAKIADARTDETALVRIGVSPHAPYSVSDALFTSVAAFARESALPVAVHIAESDAERRLVVDGDGPFADALAARGIELTVRGRSPVALLDRCGVLDARPLLIHCARVDAADIARIAATGCTVAHCPASNAKLAHGIAPLGDILAAGIPVGLGSDSVASNNRMDLLDEARLASLMQRARTGRPAEIPAQRALEMATIGGARALGIADRVGSLEAGKDADLAAFDLAGLHAAPAFDPVTTAIFSLTGRDACFVAVAGRVLRGRNHTRAAAAGRVETHLPSASSVERGGTPRIASSSEPREATK
jgi:5-methylthioadenosine/S-adenosylhomocysteine deaminase